MMFREGKSSTDHSVIFCAIAWLQVLLILHQASSQPTGQTQEDAYGSDSNFDPSMPIIVVVLVGIFFFIGFLFIYIRHCTTHPEGRSLLQTAVTDRSRQHGLDPAVLETFPIFAYSSVKDVKLGEGVLECAVCLSQFEDDETLRLITKCNHVFHLDCIDAWLAFQSTCPVCRAKLSSESSELDKVGNTPQQRAEPNTEIINDGGNAEAEVVNQVVISVNDDQNRELQEIETTLKQNPPPRSRISGKFPRSHSTGHSLAQPGESTERYTLRLPEEVRKRIEADFKLKRTITDGAAFASEEIMNSMKGRSTEDGSGRGKTLTERWIFSVTPPFVSRSGTVKSPKAGGEGETGNVVTLLTSSVKVPLKCLSLKVDRAEGSSRWPSV